jgi:Family of unknown function (DUF6246)
VLVECGFVRAAIDGGEEYTFTPSFGRIAALGSPHEIVQTFAALHGPRAAQEAAYVLAGLCDQDDPAPLIGWRDADGTQHPGAMPEAEQIVIARHLMQHGICGKARPGGAPADGKFSDRFDAAEYVSAARVHLGLSSADAEALSMTEFQTMFAMKFPNAKGGAKDVPTRDEYEAAMARVKGAGRG